MKKLTVCLSVLLALCCCVLLLPSQVSATGMDEGKCGDYVYWKYDLDGTLTISGIGKMWTFYTGEGPWAAFSAAVKRVVIEDGVTSISQYAFRDFENLSTVQIPDSVQEIGGAAFYNCTALTEITLPSGITEIAFSTFYGCSALRAIVLPDGVEEIAASGFEGCTSLEYIVLPDGVEGIADSGFEGCTSLEYMVIPASLRGMGEDALKDCTSLGHIFYCGRKGQWKNLTNPITLSPFCGDEDVAVVLKAAKVHCGVRWRNQFDPDTDLCKICLRNIVIPVALAAVAVLVAVKLIRRRNRLF